MIKTNEMLKNHKMYLNRINQSIKSVLSNSDVYVFGSILDGNLVGASDIDILIIADVPKKHLKRAEIIAKIEENAGLPLSHPFEFHLLTELELKKWIKIYKFKAKKNSSYL